jgi:hypothetical protein
MIESLRNKIKDDLQSKSTAYFMLTVFLCACVVEFMRSGIMRSFFFRSPTVDRVGGKYRGCLRRKLNIQRKREERKRKTQKQQ